MSFEWFIAKRYLQSHRRNRFLSFISTFAVIGIMLGTAALIITLSILGGFEREIRDKVVGFTSHIQVVGFHNQPLSDYPKSLELVRKTIGGVKSISPYVAKESMIRSKAAIDGVFLKGVNPATDVSSVREYLVEGRYFGREEGSDHELIIGKKLANRLDVSVGDKVVVFALPFGENQTLQPKAMQFRIVGLYESGMSEYDDVYAYATLTSAQNLFQLGENATGFDVLVHDLSAVDGVANQLQEALGYPHYATTVFQNYRNLFSWVDLQKKLSPILMGLIIVVASVNTIGTLLMFVLEKTQAIGILKSLGASPKQIGTIFRLQGIFISLVGIVAGNVVGFLVCWIQMKFRLLSLPSEIYFMSSVPMKIDPMNFIFVSAVAFILSLLTAVYPSSSAARLDPVEVLRFG